MAENNTTTERPAYLVPGIDTQVIATVGYLRTQGDRYAG